MELTLESRFKLRSIEIDLEKVTLLDKEELALLAENILTRINFYEGFKSTDFREYKTTLENDLNLQIETRKINSMTLDELKEYFLQLCHKLETIKEEFKQLLKGEM